jgi:hypothetical protein
MAVASHPGRWFSVSLLVLFVVAGLGSSGAFAQPAAGAQPSSTVMAASTGGVAAVVTWNGQNIVSAPAISSAISTDFSSTIDVHYNWSSTGTSYTISDARLQIFYFGFALGTRDIIDSNPVAATNGSFDMPWDPGVLQWLIIGTYALTASLLAPNGTTMWSEQFYLHVSAPAAIGAAIPIILILIGIWEVYSLARSGRQAAITSPAKRKGDGPLGSTPTTDPTTGTEVSTGTTSATDSAPPKEPA